MLQKMDIFPDVIRIEPVGICNFKCIHCPTGVQTNKRKLLQLNKFLEILNQFTSKLIIPRVVVLYHGGEPLLNREISHYISILKNMGVTKVHIVTNGSCLTSQVSKELIASGLDEIHISFDGESIEENDAIRSNGNFYRDASNVKEFYKIYKKNGNKKIRILISNVQIPSEEWFKDIESVTDSLRPPRYLKEYFNDCLDIEIQSLIAMAWPGFNSNGNLKTVKLIKNNISYCKSLFETLTILANGDVVPCCYDLLGEVVFGNVFECDIFDIWGNNKYREFRKKIRNKTYPHFCSKCSIISSRYLCKTDSLVNEK